MKAFDVPVAQASIASLLAALTGGQFTARALAAHFLERIDALDQQGPTLNAVVTRNTRALAEAEALDAALARTGKPVGPLHGIPMVVKDCLETADMPTSFGSEAFADYRAAADATVIAKLRAAGAVILAKTTLPDWATSWFAYSSRSGETRNPYDLARDPGGSSGGTGAAVAAAYATAGLGTDCGGSVRLPASFCNLVGVRSTPGLISRRGCNPLVGFQDTIGPLARSVEDAARVFDVLVGYDANDPLTCAYIAARAPASYLDGLTPDALTGMRIGVLRTAFGRDDDEASAPVNRVMDAALGDLVAGGCTLVDLELPGLAEHVVESSLYLVKSRSDIDRFLAESPGAPMRTVADIVASGRYHPKLDLLEGIAAGPTDPLQDPAFVAGYLARERFMQAVVRLMADAQVSTLVYPTCQVVPPLRAETDSGRWTTLNFPTNTLIGSQTWLPAMTVPAGLSAAGLPVGMEILARPYDEPTMFRVAYGFERLRDRRLLPACAR